MQSAMLALVDTSLSKQLSLRNQTQDTAAPASCTHSCRDAQPADLGDLVREAPNVACCNLHSHAAPCINHLENLEKRLQDQKSKNGWAS